jgi:hypothetical protein
MTCRVTSGPGSESIPIGEGTQRAEASAASHRQNADPRSWFLCRAADQAAQKSPATGTGLSSPTSAGLPVFRE